ncbi:MAG: hypothetical protein ACJ749_06990, partial [Flavisolibacter sp.]
LLKLRLKSSLFFPLCLLTGVGIFSLLPFFLQLCFIPLTKVNIFIAIAVCAILVNIRADKSLQLLKLKWQEANMRIRLYEIPFIVVIAFLVFVSVWRCFYFPPTPRDLTSGAEVIADYAVKEKTMINSVFTVSLETTNNQYKPPFITSLQVIYKYAGFPFGQLWLSTIFISFLLFLYGALSMHLHRLIAGFLLVVFLVIPEMYAYSFMVLYDYSNAVFFTVSVYFLLPYFRSGDRVSLVFSALMMAMATYARSETLVLAGFLSLAIAWHHIKHWDGLMKIAKTMIIFLLPSFLIYVLTVIIYNNWYLPSAYAVGDLINPHLLNPVPFFERFWQLNTRLIFSEDGVNYYAYFIFFFLLVLVLDLIWTDRWEWESSNWIFPIIVVYIGLPFLGYLLPLMDLDNSTKRGLFKIFPLMLLYMGSSGVLRGFSQRITQWEEKA